MTPCVGVQTGVASRDLCGFSAALQEEPNQQQQRDCRRNSLSDCTPNFSHTTAHTKFRRRRTPCVRVQTGVASRDCADLLVHFRRNPINSNNVVVEQFLLVRLHFQVFSYNRPYKIQTTNDPLCGCPDWSCEQRFVRIFWCTSGGTQSTATTWLSNNFS